MLNKKDTFLFSNNSISYLDNKILPKLFYASVNSEILRITTTTTDLANMLAWINILLIRMQKQDIRYHLVTRYSYHFTSKKGNIFKYFKGLQLLLLNLASCSLYNWFTCMYVYVCFYAKLDAYLCISCVWYISVCGYVAMYLWLQLIITLMLVNSLVYE